MPRSWIGEIGALRSLTEAEGRAMLSGILLRQCGPPYRLRDARARLFLLSTAVLGGQPTMIEVDNRILVMMSVTDLGEIVCGGGLESFFAAARRVASQGRGRRKVKNR